MMKRYKASCTFSVIAFFFLTYAGVANATITNVIRLAGTHKSFDVNNRVLTVSYMAEADWEKFEGKYTELDDPPLASYSGDIEGRLSVPIAGPGPALGQPGTFVLKGTFADLGFYDDLLMANIVTGRDGVTLFGGVGVELLATRGLLFNPFGEVSWELFQDVDTDQLGLIDLTTFDFSTSFDGDGPSFDIIVIEQQIEGPSVANVVSTSLIELFNSEVSYQVDGDIGILTVSNFGESEWDEYAGSSDDVASSSPFVEREGDILSKLTVPIGIGGSFPEILPGGRFFVRGAFPGADYDDDLILSGDAIGRGIDLFGGIGVNLLPTAGLVPGTFGKVSWELFQQVVTDADEVIDLTTFDFSASFSGSMTASSFIVIEHTAEEPSIVWLFLIGMGLMTWRSASKSRGHSI